MSRSQEPEVRFRGLPGGDIILSPLGRVGFLVRMIQSSAVLTWSLYLSYRRVPASRLLPCGNIPDICRVFRQVQRSAFRTFRQRQPAIEHTARYGQL